MVNFGSHHIHHAEEFHHPGNSEGQATEGQGFFNTLHQVQVWQVLRKYSSTRLVNRNYMQNYDRSRSFTCDTYTFGLLFILQHFFISLTDLSVPKYHYRDSTINPILKHICSFCERGKYWLTFFLIDKYVASISSGNFVAVRYGRKVMKPRNFPKSLSVNKLEIKTSFSSCIKIK